MPVQCRNCPIRKRPLFAPMSESEVDFMEGFKTGELEVDPGTTLMLEGSNSPQLYTALEGMGIRYKSFASGERQVIGFVLPGDFIGLQAGVMDAMQHSVEATTKMRLCVFDRKRLWSLFQDHPERAYDLTWISAVEEHFLGESLSVVGQMSGIERVARAIAQFHDRGNALGMVEGKRMPLPFRQQDLADALGLSLVHTNKMLRRLCAEGIAEWKNGWLKVLDSARLCETAQLPADREPMTRPLI